EWRIEPSQPAGDAPCPVCGQLVWFDPHGISQRVRELVTRNLGIRAGNLAGRSSFIEDVGADSLDIVELIMELEEEFEITIPNEQAETIKTLDARTDFIVRRLGHRREED